MLGACGVEPFKARSLDARRRNRPPRVASLSPPPNSLSSETLLERFPVSLSRYYRLALHLGQHLENGRATHAPHTSNLRETLFSISFICLSIAFLHPAAACLSRRDATSRAFPLVICFFSFFSFSFFFFFFFLAFSLPLFLGFVVLC